MNPFFFGSSSRPLYGVYHPPSTHPARKEGVLLCPPFGQEYMRAHRTFRQLALLLNKKGFAVLRFDYFGTGDSSGYIEEASTKEWLTNIELASTELKEMAKVEKIHCVGLRLGGLLACASTEKLDIEKLVLWDTVISGEAYDKELQLEIEKDDEDYAFNQIDQDGTLHFNGFAMTQKIRDDLQEINLCDMTPKAKKTLHITSQETNDASTLKQQWAEVDTYNYQLVHATGDWNYVDDFGGILLPQQVVQAVVNWIDKS